MGYVHIKEQTAQALELVPGAEYRVASAVTLVIGLTGCGAAGLIMFSEPFGGVIVLYIALAFLFAALMLRSRQRKIKIDLEDKAFYLLGQRSSDIAVVPFWRVERLRLRRVARAKQGEAPRVGSTQHDPSAGNWELDIVLRDGGYVGLERSTALSNISRLGVLLAEYTGIAFEDASSIQQSVAASRQYTPDGDDVPDVPPPGSVLNSHDEATGWSWSHSFSGYGLWLFMIIIVSLAVVAAIGMTVMLRSGISFAGIAIVFMSAFFLQLLGKRFCGILFGKSWISLGDGRCVTGTKCFIRPTITWDIALKDVLDFRVNLPVTGQASLECLTHDGRVLPVMSLVPGLSVVTPGDLFWLAAYLRVRVQRLSV